MKSILSKNIYLSPYHDAPLELHVFDYKILETFGTSGA